MAIERVCSSCFEDRDIRSWIRVQGGPRGCDACGKFDSPTAPMDELCEHIENCISRYWGDAAEQMTYVTAEGGYVGQTWTTYEILNEEIEIQLPRDRSGLLLNCLVHGISDRAWCDYDWLSLDTDQALLTSWNEFCRTVKHRRRFFFQTAREDDRDSYSVTSLLSSVAAFAEHTGLVVKIGSGTRLWRARPDLRARSRVAPADFGPPPPAIALQSNRMNPPGIPMLYLASSARAAVRETKSARSKVGQWELIVDLRVLDLRSLPPVPGYFSVVDREYRLYARFLREFTQSIMQPVERDERQHIDYLPSQVATEYFRDFAFQRGNIDGIAYGSTVGDGWNVVLFAEASDLGLGSIDEWRIPDRPWLRFIKAKMSVA